MNPNQIDIVELSVAQSLKIQRFMQKFALLSRKWANGFEFLVKEAPIAARRILGDDDFQTIRAVASDSGTAVVIEDRGEKARFLTPGRKANFLRENENSAYVQHLRRKSLFMVAAMGLTPMPWDHRYPYKHMTKAVAPEEFGKTDSTFPNHLCLATSPYQTGLDLPPDYAARLIGPFRPRVVGYLSPFVSWGLAETGPMIVSVKEIVDLLEAACLEKLSANAFELEPNGYLKGGEETEAADHSYLYTLHVPVVIRRANGVVHGNIRLGKVGQIVAELHTHRDAVRNLIDVLSQLRRKTERITLKSYQALFVNNYTMVREWNMSARSTTAFANRVNLRNGQRIIYRVGGYAADGWQSNCGAGQSAPSTQHQVAA